MTLHCVILTFELSKRGKEDFIDAVRQQYPEAILAHREFSKKGRLKSCSILTFHEADDPGTAAEVAATLFEPISKAYVRPLIIAAYGIKPVTSKP